MYDITFNTNWSVGLPGSVAAEKKGKLQVLKTQSDLI